MKKLYIFGILLTALIAFTACDDTNTTRTGSNGGGSGGTNTSTNVLAPSSLQNRLIVGQINSGTSPFASAGSFMLTPAGSTDGTFTSDGMGTNGTTSGNFNFAPVGNNQGTLALNDTQLGTVTINLQFQTSNSGTFTTSSSGGGSQTGTFTLQ